MQKAFPLSPPELTDITFKETLRSVILQGGPKVLTVLMISRTSRDGLSTHWYYFDIILPIAMRPCNLVIICSNTSESARIGIAFKTILTAEIISFSDLKFLPSRYFFKYLNKKKSQGAKPRE
jgi:hypothetical protein